MTFEINNNHRALKDLYDDCKKHMYYHVTLIMTDGSAHDGILENVDGNNISMLIGENAMEMENENQSNQQRQVGWHGPYGPRYMRYRRRVFPLANLAQLALLPYVVPPVYPYPYPYKSDRSHVVL